MRKYFEMWMYIRMEGVRWIEKLKNVDMLTRIGEKIKNIKNVSEKKNELPWMLHENKLPDDK